ncbi:hypothetical protein V3473_30875, partial [Pseudomonas aeruginosa]|uniref:hypothetical protein n=1 Tax=Pseudomonas aeruginosa TaxID=287 RepID=UPI002F948C7E
PAALKPWSHWPASRDAGGLTFQTNPNIVVVIKEDGMFLSGWYLEPGSKQEKNYFENEVL